MILDELIGLLISLVVFVAICFGAISFSEHSCKSTWADVGATRWSISTKCQVYYKGRWVPSSSIREL